MLKIKILPAAAALILLLSFTFQAFVSAATTDRFTRFRVYQFNQLLLEFADYTKAEGYARQYSYSHVEEIGTRKWVWNNFPGYTVYQKDKPIENGSFSRLEDAVAFASGYRNASVRDIQAGGWAWNNYPRFQVYQGDFTQDNWRFATYGEAIAEAAHWSGSHIISLDDNSWAWDNLSDTDKRNGRAQPLVYRIDSPGASGGIPAFAFLEDAIRNAQKIPGSIVVNTSGKERTVYTNSRPYRIYQNNNALTDFSNLSEAVAYAKQFGHTTIRLEGVSLWNNTPYYQVFQNSNRIGEFTTITEAVNYAIQYDHSSVKTIHGQLLWDNAKKLQLWGWNGVSNTDTIVSQLSTTRGLDVDSPTWFQLADAQGNIKDASTQAGADRLKAMGYTVIPLVHNQFNSSLTTQFLANKKAQQKFIHTLVDRVRALNLDGINVDFESVSGKDRAAFTAFIGDLTDYAHDNGLKVSIDLPRGSVSWNHLTAFDHASLGQIVDYIVTMTYDEHYTTGSTAGSVAGIPWVEQGIRDFLSYGIPRDKLIMGVPFYTREWTLDSSGALLSNRSIYLKDIPALMESVSTTSTWEEGPMQYRINYTGSDGLAKVFWLEDENTLKARMDIAAKYDIAGVAAWRLGYETQQTWTTINGKR